MDPLPQLPDEVLHHIWTLLPTNEGASGSRAAWRLSCRHLNGQVFRHCTSLAWQGHDRVSSRARGNWWCSSSSSSGEDSSLKALLQKVSASASGEGLQHLKFGSLHLQEGHCRALSVGVVIGKLRRLRTLEINPTEPLTTAAHMTLYALLGHCRQLTNFDARNGYEDPSEQVLCPACDMLCAVPAPADHFPGLRVLRLCGWLFDHSQLLALRDALLTNLTQLTELSLSRWHVDETTAEAALVDVVAASLASGTLEKLDISYQSSVLHARLCSDQEERLSQALASHSCVLDTILAYNAFTHPALVLPVLEHNKQLRSLSFTALSTYNLTARDFAPAAAALGHLTQLASLTLGWSHDDFSPVARALKNLPSLRHLAMYGGEEAPLLGMQTIRELAAALRKLHGLESLTVSGGPTFSSAVTAVLLWCPGNQLRALHLNPVTVPPHMQTAGLRTFSTGIQRFTSLEKLVLRNFTCESSERMHLAAAATIASALPHLTRLEHLDVSVDREVRRRPAVTATRAATHSIIAAACLLPSLKVLNLTGCLGCDDRADVHDMLHASMPGLTLEL